MMIRKATDLEQILFTPNRFLKAASFIFLLILPYNITSVINSVFDVWDRQEFLFNIFGYVFMCGLILAVIVSFIYSEVKKKYENTLLFINEENVAYVIENGHILATEMVFFEDCYAIKKGNELVVLPIYLLKNKKCQHITNVHLGFNTIIYNVDLFVKNDSESLLYYYKQSPLLPDDVSIIFTKIMETFWENNNRNIEIQEFYDELEYIFPQEHYCVFLRNLQ